MPRFDVYANPGSHAKTTPYLLDVQSDLLDDLESRVVIPLRSLQNFIWTPPVCQDLCRCVGTDRLQFYIRPVVQVDTCWP
ncbi:MAG: CcdB family protein [Burkholderiaceae bacterium]|nr:CcdB family protein [Burkholderiaceae bacterium]